MCETNATALGALTVLDADKKSIQVSTLWEKQTAVMVFVRHFG